MNDEAAPPMGTRSGAARAASEDHAPTMIAWSTTGHLSGGIPSLDAAEADYYARLSRGNRRWFNRRWFNRRWFSRTLLAGLGVLVLIAVVGLLWLRPTSRQPTWAQQASAEQASADRGSAQEGSAQRGTTTQRTAQPAATRDTARRRTILTAAEGAMETIGSFSYKTADRDLSRIVAVTTGTLNKQLRAGLARTKRQIVDQQLTRKATVARRALDEVDETGTRATVTLLIQSRGTSKDQPSAIVQRYRVRLMMVRSNGRWLVASVTTPAPA